MTPDQVTRYRSKAAIVAMAWQQTLAESPTVHALILAMAVADFETRLGDAGGTWKGEHNWGAIHKRSLTAEEASILLGHGVYPTGDDALRTARGLLAAGAGANEALHIDKNNVGPYFVWFWAFPNDTEGAAKYLEILVKNRPGVRAIIDTATPVQLAAALYTTKYFEGTSRDPQENIRAYGAQVAAYAAKIESALQGWPPAMPAGPPPAPGPFAGGGPRSAPPALAKGGSSLWWWAGIACVGVGAFYYGRRGA
jgi:hypothetical protein